MSESNDTPPNPESEAIVLTLTPAEYRALGNGEAIEFGGPALIEGDPRFVVEVER